MAIAKKKEEALQVNKEVKNVELVEFDKKAKHGSKLFERDFSMISNVKVNLEVVVGNAEISVAELFELRESSIVELSQTQDAPIQLRLDDKVIAYGSLVLVGDNFGLRISHILNE